MRTSVAIVAVLSVIVLPLIDEVRYSFIVGFMIGYVLDKLIRIIVER